MSPPRHLDGWERMARNVPHTGNRIFVKPKVVFAQENVFPLSILFIVFFELCTLYYSLVSGTPGCRHLLFPRNAGTGILKILAHQGRERNCSAAAAEGSRPKTDA